MAAENSAPLVSVVMPVYNRSQALRRTVDSVLAQTLPDWELHLVDDGSTDDTPAVAESYTDPRVHYIRQPNRGHSAARNTGLARARGEFIAFLDHDDRWRPGKLRSQVDHLRQHPETTLVYAQWARMDESGKLHGEGVSHIVQGPAERDLLIRHNFVQSMSLPMMRTEMVRRLGGFRAEMDICDDLDLFIRLARLGPFGFIPETLLDYNMGSVGQQSRNITRGILSLYRCLTAHLSQDTSLSVEERAALLVQVREFASHEVRCQGWHALRRGDLAASRRFYWLAVSIRPAILRDQALLRDLGGLTHKSIRAALGLRKGAKS